MVFQRALVLGATGLVGGELVAALASDSAVQRVILLSRRPMDRTSLGANARKIDEHLADLSRLEEDADAFAVDRVFCALGTTIRQAGSEEKFRAVDFDYVVRAARRARSAGVPHFLVVSAMGADARSRVFYNRVKGEMEAAVTALGFPSLTIARPSLLLGVRAEFRLGERAAALFGWLAPAAYKPISSRAVAGALIAAARENRPGVRVLSNREMRIPTPEASLSR